MSFTIPKVISTDFVALIEPLPDGGSLQEEVNEAISTAVCEVVNCNAGADSCDLIFDVEPSAGDKTAIDGIVAAHTGEIVGVGMESIVTATFGPSPTIVASPGDTPTIDWNLCQKYEITLDATVTGITFIDPPGIGNFMLIVKQPAGANHPIESGAWPGNVRWSLGLKPIMTPTNEAVDILAFYYDGTDYHGAYSPDGK